MNSTPEGIERKPSIKSYFVLSAWIDFRSIWAAALLILILISVLPESFSDNQGLRLLGRLDEARSVFWFLVFAFGIGAVIPFPKGGLSNKLFLVLQWFVLLLAVLWGIWAIFYLAGIGEFYAAYKLAFVFVALNILSSLAVGLSTGESGPIYRLSGVPLVLDIFLPAGLWTARRRLRWPERRLPHVRRTIVYAVICLAAGLFSVYGMLTAPWRPEAWPYRDRVLHARESYGLVMDRDRRIAMAATFTDGVFVVDTATGRVKSNIAVPTDRDLTNLAYDTGRGIIYAVDAGGRFFAIDPDSSAVDSPGELQGGGFGLVVMGEVSPDGNSLWLSLDGDGEIRKIDVDDLAVLDSYTPPEPSITDLLVLHDRNLLYALSLEGSLFKLRLSDLELLQSLKLEPNSAQMAFDAHDGRLYISLPTQGRVLIVDPQNMKVEGDLPTDIGCRAVRVLPEQRLLFVAGFSPYLKVFDLEDRALLARIHCPPWVRGIAPDAQSGLVVLTDKHIGLTVFDFGSELEKTGSGRKAWDDPFFKLARYLGTSLQ